MSPIKDLTLTYEAVNVADTFSAGDTVTGTLSFTLTKEIKVKELLVKVKGDASVHWSEGTGDNRKSYSAFRRYFKEKEDLLAGNAKGNVLQEGAHHFNFSLKIPQGDMPPSFKGLHGNIVYMIEAKLSRKWHLPSIKQKELNFVSKSFLQPVVCPLAGSVNKETGVFTKGEVQMSATINKNACSPGETLSIGAKINNSSAKEMKPKFSLQQKSLYHAIGRTNISEQSVCKVVGNPIAPNSEETVCCQMTIPQDINLAIHNCEIISVEYYIKVYLDISFAIDPTVVFPISIVPFGFPIHQSGQAPSYSDFPPPAFPFGPAGPGAYGHPAPYPANIASGYNNPFPQQAAPYGFSNAAFPPSSVQHPAPTAPPLFQHGEEPPSYMSVFPPSVSGSDSKT